MLLSVSLPLPCSAAIGFSGADLANLLNEAAILAGRKSLAAVRNLEIDEAVDRCVSLGVAREGFKREKGLGVAGVCEGIVCLHVVCCGCVPLLGAHPLVSLLRCLILLLSCSQPTTKPTPPPCD